MGTEREVRTLSGHESRVLAVALTPDGRHIVSGSSDNTLKVWEVETGLEVRTRLLDRPTCFASCC